jgi:hypothetical protein
MHTYKPAYIERVREKPTEFQKPLFICRGAGALYIHKNLPSRFLSLPQYLLIVYYLQEKVEAVEFS